MESLTQIESNGQIVRLKVGAWEAVVAVFEPKMAMIWIKSSSTGSVFSLTQEEEQLISSSFLFWGDKEDVEKLNTVFQGAGSAISVNLFKDAAKKRQIPLLVTIIHEGILKADPMLVKENLASLEAAIAFRLLELQDLKPPICAG